ncbi:MAG: hypothetical protein NW216_05895 [Hyphomicrobium sp.]|nr:hypothetical protein [Hyphomicrobium sp.]
MPKAAIPDGSVSSDPEEIRVQSSGRDADIIRWSDIGRLAITVRCDGDASPRLDWILEHVDGRTTLHVPMGMAGEHDLVMTMQVRLHGFDRMAVVEALSAPKSARFEVWDRSWPLE